MTTVAKTFGIRNGLDVANTIVIDSNRYLSNIVGANVTTANATTVNSQNFITSAGLDVTGQANAAYNQANTARNAANGAYAQANGAYAQANGAYAQANGAYGQANGAYAQANNAANTVRVSQNGAGTLSSKQLNFVNSASVLVAISDSGDGNANIVLAVSGAAAGDAYAQANAARNQANNAYLAANNSNLKSGGTISGDLTVSGNLILSQNTTLINVSTYQVEDPLIYLASNNYVSDAVDIGFMGGKNTSGTYSHTGLIRHAADQKYYLFDGLPDESHTNNVINVASTYLATLRANLEANSIFLVGNVVATQANLTLAHNQANTARTTANNAYDAANNAYDNAALGQTIGSNAYSKANSAANTVRVSSNSGATLSSKQLNFVNTSSVLVTLTDSGDGNANISITATGASAGDAYNQANLAYTRANDTLNIANSKVATINGVGPIGVTPNNYLPANNLDYQIYIANASTTSRGATLLIDSVSSSDTANAATAHAVKLAYDNGTAGQIVGSAAYDQANVAYNQANTARNQANAAYGQANTAYNLAGNAYTTANNAYIAANNAYAEANLKVNLSGGTLSGGLTINTSGAGLTVANANVTNSLTVGKLNVTTNTVTTSSSGQVVLDRFLLTDFASAKYFVQANSGVNYTVTEMIVMHDGINIYLTEYGTIQSGASIGTFSADIDTGNARLLFTANNNVNTIRSVRYGVLAP